jgi:hypothetical protein
MKRLTSILILGLLFWSCENPSIKELGQGYFLARNSMNDHSIAKPTEGYSTSEVFSVIIYGDIVSFDFDSRFIIAAEKPRDSVSGIKDLRYEEAERLFKKSNFRQYYILDKKDEHLYGPYSRKIFDTKKKELNVSDSLNIESNSR